VNDFRNDGPRRTIKQTEADWGNRYAREIIGGTEYRICKAIGRAGVDKGSEVRQDLWRMEDGA